MAKILIGAKVFEISDETLKEAVEKGAEIKIESDVVIREKAEDETFQANLRTEAKTAGIEIAVKDARTKLGLDFQGKTIDNLIEAVKTKTLEDAKIEPEEKLKNAQKDIETLKVTIQTLTSEKQQIETQFGTFKKEGAINQKIQSLLPENLAIPKDDILLIMKNKMSFDLDDAGRVVVKNSAGEIVKNPTTLDPIDPKDEISKFFTDNKMYLKGNDGGAGGGDSGGGSGKMTTEAFIALKAKEGINHTDPKFIEEYDKLSKDGLIEDKE